MPPKKAVVKELPEPSEPSEFIEIPFQDSKIPVPRERGNWPTRAVLALQRGDNLQAVELTIGAEQWDRVTDSTLDEFNAFCDAFGDVAKQAFAT